jgi:predicted membrane-bound dolichyl-phosphate-mannose-protein mannosyltransferase
MIPEIKPEVTSEIPPETPQETILPVPPEPLTEVVAVIPPVVVPRNRWQRFLHWEYLGLFIILLTTLVFHFIAIEHPPTIVWDEVWYVGDTRSIVSGTGELRPEHPPLAKLFMVAGEFIFNGFKIPEKDTGATTSVYLGDNGSDTQIYINNAANFKVETTIRIQSEQMTVKGVNTALNQISVERGTGGTTVASHTAKQTIYVFTDNAFGWRFFSIIFGTLGIVLFYFICRKLGFSWKATMIATFLFAFEDMTFLHSGLALLDVYMVTFMLAAVLAYLDGKYILMGVFVALSANCKLAGVLILVAIFIHWAIYRKDKWKSFSLSLVVAAVSFVVFVAFFDFFIKGGFENPITRINSMLSGTAANQFTVPKLSISSRPWTWIYPQFIDPSYNSPFITYSYNPWYISFISTTIQILIIPTIGYMIYKAIFAVKKSQVAGLVLLWFLATYLVWMPLGAPIKFKVFSTLVQTNRVTFVFYFLSTTPAICIGIAMAISDWLEHLKKRRAELNRLSTGIALSYGTIGVYLLVHLAIFIFYLALPSIFTTFKPPFAR